MGWWQQSSAQLVRQFKANISRRVHDRRLQIRLQIGTSIALGVGLLLSAALFLGILDFPQAGLSDLFYQPFDPSGQVVIVAIDDESIKQLGDWPWHRTTLAELIDAVVQTQPRGIALDILLPDPSNEDSILASSLQRAPWVIQPVIGAETLRLPTSNSVFPHYDTALVPSRSLQTPNTILANGMILPDDGGIVRRIPSAIQVGERRYLAFSMAALTAFTGQTLKPQIENNKIDFGSLRLPVDAQGQMRINFTSERPAISAIKVMNRDIAPDSLHNKIVLIGLINSTAHQELKTPLMLGTHPTWPIEIHADIIDMVLGNHLLSDQDRLTEILVIFLVALMAGATLPNVRVLTAIALTLIYLLMYISYAIQNFTSGILVKPVYPMLAVIFTAIATILYQYFSEERHLEALRRLLRRYVPPELVEQVLRASDNGALPLESIRRDVSIVYIDLRDLAAIASTLNAQAMMNLLNQYTNLAVTAVFRSEGSIAKRTGDTILAVWNLPLDQKDYAIRAVRTALDIWRECAEFKQHQPQELAISIGIGIATGRVTAGHIGRATQEEFTLVGEAVGMAERMAIKPDRGVYIDAETRQKIGDTFDTYQANPIRLRRHTDPVDVWLLVDPTELQKQADAEAKVEEIEAMEI